MPAIFIFILVFISVVVIILVKRRRANLKSNTNRGFPGNGAGTDTVENNSEQTCATDNTEELKDQLSKKEQDKSGKAPSDGDGISESDPHERAEQTESSYIGAAVGYTCDVGSRTISAVGSSVNYYLTSIASVVYGNPTEDHETSEADCEN